MIQELARRLDEAGKCKKNEISAKIKKLLADKIRDHKITVKGIEECLPQEYKRSYRSKSELNSLLKKVENNKVQESKVIDIVDNRDGSVLLTNRDTENNNFSDTNRENIATDVPNSRGFKRQGYETSVDNKDPDHELYEENRELKEALKWQTAMVMGDQIASTEMEFKIPKERYDEIEEAMVDSKYFCYMIFDKSGTMVRVVPDNFKTN